MTSRLVVLALMMVVMLAAACAAGEATPSERLRPAVGQLQKAGGATVRIEATYHNQPSPTSVVTTGVVDVAHRRSEVTTTLPRTGKVRRVYADGRAYEWRPITGWTFTDVRTAIRGSPPFGLGHLAGNPVLLLDLMRVLGRPTDAGDGRTRAEADLTRLPDVDPVWSPLAGQLSSAASTRTVPVEVGTDSDGQVSLLRVTLPLPKEGMAPGARPDVDVTVRFSHHGAPATITPPPAEKTRDITAQVVKPTGG